MTPMSKSIERYNIHTHSFYCGHGSGTIAEYVDEAVGKGLVLLGFSEHCPFPDGFLLRSRMRFEQMKDYESDIRVQQERVEMPIKTGYECDYFPRYRSFFEDLRASGRVDYLITGTHFIVRADESRVSPFSDRLEPDDVLRFCDQLVGALDTGLFDFVAHPDLYMAGYFQWDDTARRAARDIIQAAKDHDVPLEINANGLQKPQVDGRAPYPYGPFWDMVAEMGAKAILSTDAHKVSNLVARRPLIEAFAQEHGVSLVAPVAAPGPLEWAG